MSGPTYDPEKFQLTLISLRKGKEEFEIVVDPDAALSFRDGNAVDLDVVLKSRQIFVDAQKGMHASMKHALQLFGFEEEEDLFSKFIKEGELHLTTEFKTKLREQKKKQIISLIARNAIDPRTGLPHPASRIEHALTEAKVRIHEFKAASDQMKGIVKALQSILPLKFETKEIEVLVEVKFASRAQSLLKQYGEVKHTEWKSDGSLLAILLIPGGLLHEFIDKLNGVTHATGHITLLSKTEKENYE